MAVSFWTGGGKAALREKAERSLATLAKISGIFNEVVLRKLIEMNVHLEVLATLSIIPLIEVAWADGKIEEEQREAVLKGAESYGLLKDQIGYNLLDARWLVRMAGLLITLPFRAPLGKDYTQP